MQTQTPGGYVNGSDWFIVLIVTIGWLVARFERGELFDVPGKVRPAPRRITRMDDL